MRYFAFPAGQVVLLFLLLGLGGPFILTTISTASFSAVLLLGFVSVIGLLLCRYTQVRLEDPALKILGYLWLIKLGVTLFLLYAGWIPQLDPASSDTWGYDPQRYYVQAQELIDQNWSIGPISLNYTGILYYYGSIFYVFGHNPVVPALINAFVTLIATLYLVKVGYEIKSHREPRDWTLAFGLLLPEMLWYDVMTARETVMAAMLLFTTLTMGRYFARTAAISLPRLLIVAGLSALAIAAVRAPLLLPMAVSIVLMALLVRPQSRSRVVQNTVLVVFAFAALMVLPTIPELLGGYEFGVGNALQIATSGENNIALTAAAQWSQKSIGLLLIPQSPLQAILFLPPRMVLYLVSPLPYIYITFDALRAGDYASWQNLCTLPASVINTLGMPYALASLVQSIRTRKANAAPLVLHISYWTMLTAIAGGNLIIQERYRVMAAPLLWGCMWLGARTCSKNLIIETALFWYGLLFMGALAYLFYKGVL